MPESRESVRPTAITREFVLTGDSAAMIAVRDRIMDFLHEHCIDEQQEIDLMVALQEGLVNAVLHGCGNDPSKTVHCSVEIDADAITIVITDPGKGFDTAGTIDSSDDGTNLTQHGRGIMMIRSLMDEVHYRHGGSELEMKKLRSPAR